ncbi:MAG: iron ABC transporter permease [Coriobacteriia bacterium]|nr:iron ABC transporter permease [Coriobacteriia bacterium]
MTPAPGRSRTALVIAGLAVTLVLAIIAGIAFGAVPVSPGDVISALGSLFSGSERTLTDALVLDLRLPRVVLAALVGAALALAGVLYQALFRNPLADPYILGVSSGAGLGATLAMMALGTSYAMRAVGVPVGAFVGAGLTMLLVVRLASSRGKMEPTSLLLAGMAVSYILSALTSFLLVLDREQMSSVVFWMMGGLQNRSWEHVGSLAVMLALGSIAPALYHRELDLMLLGDERAGQLGVSVERFKMIALASASLVVAGAVSVSGLIGFIGLMTPHMMRLALGPRHRLLLPASVLAGAVVLVVADLLARLVLAPVEIPVGIVTALAGGPFFLWILVRRDRVR